MLGERPLKSTRDEIKRLLESEGIKQNDILLFIPKEVYEEEFSQFGKSLDWAYGLLAYATLGVPLVHGIKEITHSYGYVYLPEQTGWLSISEIDKSNMCSFKKKILILEKMKPLTLSLYKCEQL